MKNLLIVIALCYANLMTAQVRKDFIVTNEGDTIIGKITSTNWYSLSKSIEFTNESGILSKFKPMEISAYNIIGFDFESIGHSKVKLLPLGNYPIQTFMLRLVNGPTQLLVEFPVYTSYAPEDELSFGLFSESSDFEDINYHVIFLNGDRVEVAKLDKVIEGTEVIFSDWPDMLYEMVGEENNYMQGMVETYNRKLLPETIDDEVFMNDPASIDIYLFRNTDEEDQSLDLKITLDGKKLPSFDSNEYLKLSLSDVNKYFLKVKGKDIKAELEFYARKNIAILIEIDLSALYSPFKIISSKDAEERYLATKKAIIVK